MPSILVKNQRASESESLDTFILFLEINSRLYICVDYYIICQKFGEWLTASQKMLNCYGNVRNVGLQANLKTNGVSLVNN